MPWDYNKFPGFRPSIQAGRKLPIRSAYMEYKDKAGQWVSLPGLNVRFSVTENIGNIYPAAQIDVCNLTREEREFLTNYFHMANPDYAGKLVRIHAGYIKSAEDWENTPALFTGNVEFTRFTPPPDIWLCMSLIYRLAASGQQREEWTMRGTHTVAEILSVGAKKLELKVDFRGTSQSELSKRTLTNFAMSGDGKLLLRKLQMSTPGYSVFINDDKLIVAKKGKEKPEKDADKVWEVAPDTGLIGIPDIQPQGIFCTTLLNPEMRPGDWVKLTSLHQALGDGYFQIMQVQHEGELRGNDFYTRIQTRRPTLRA